MKVTAIIKPNSKHREEAVKSSTGEIVIYTKEPAIEGKANQGAIKLLAKYLKVSKSQVELVRGHSSKYKIFEIDIR